MNTVLPYVCEVGASKRRMGRFQPPGVHGAHANTEGTNVFMADAAVQPPAGGKIVAADSLQNDA